MDMNRDAREAMNRWHTRQKNAERRIINFNERITLRLEAIRERMITHRQALPDWQIKQVYYRDVGQYESIDDDWRDIRVGEPWGGRDVSAFFRRTVIVPPEMDGHRLYLRIYLGGDSLLSLDGVPYHGLDPFRDTVMLSESAVGGAEHLIEIESYIFWYPAEGDINVFRQAELVTIDPDVEKAYWDFVATFKMFFIEDIETSLKSFLETHLWDSLLAVPIHEPDFTIFKVRLMDICDTFRKRVLKTDRFKSSGLLHMVGHSHLDIVYHWEHHEYIRKVGRTHATMLRLMEQYPEFKFSQSSAKIYADMKEHYPELYEQVKQRIAEGRWQPVGAFWLEPDCNLISGESLVRHILHGQRFWREEFGFASKVCWQPDVFGMSWVLPQILNRSGIEIALTNKVFVWNDTNPWRNNTFWWQGPDGSRVLGVVPPGHFIGFVDPNHMSQYWQDFSDKETIGEMIYTYGWGDGGGGVDPEMLECATRYTDFPGLVPTTFNQPEDTLLQILKKAKSVKLPIWNDELYLETHRGTYTSKALLKKRNRQSETLIRQVEIFASLAWINGADYPTAQLDKLWKLLLNTQFHDALPGTHVTKVYHYLLREYRAIYDLASEVRRVSTQQLFAHNRGQYVLVFNPTLTPYTGIIELPASLLDGQSLQTLDGKQLTQQSVTTLSGHERVLVHLDTPILSVGIAVFELANSDDNNALGDVIAEDNALENQYLRAEFNTKGELTSLWDKETQREVLQKDEVGNLFQLYEDLPGRYDAWDIIASYVEHELPIIDDCCLTIDEQGALRASLKLVRQCYDSVITQRISLTAEARHLTFETSVDWQERQKLLKVGFPVAVITRHATYDIAFGNMERANHRNTPYDAAKFEVPAHRWMDMSEGDYGVALLNDSKYGHEANGHWMRLTLLKGSISPDPVADIGQHHFTYVLYPHQGDWRNGRVNEMATRLNTPLYTQRIMEPLQSQSFVSCDADNITLEAMKLSEDGQSLIIRLVERFNRRTTTNLILNQPLQSAFSCDLMENDEQQLPVEGNQVQLTLNPREILTVRLNF